MPVRSGYREFSSYLARDARLPDLDRERAFQAAVERMKISTRQYAKRQVSWIRNKFLPAAAEANRRSRQGPDGGSPGDIVPTFLLDATGTWDRTRDLTLAADLTLTRQSSVTAGQPRCRSRPVESCKARGLFVIFPTRGCTKYSLQIFSSSGRYPIRSRYQTRPVNC